MGNIINWQKLIPAVMLAAGVLVSVNAAAAPQSEQEPLAQLQLDVDGDGTQETVELYGGQLARGSSYRHDFLLLLKSSDSELLTAYVPSIKGGYDCNLEKAGFTGRGEQLLLSVGQGGADGSTEYRIIDFADPKAVKEIFTGSDNAGVAVTTEFLPDFRSKITFADGNASYELLPEKKEFYEQRGLYAADGTLLKGYRRPAVSKINSLVPVDMEQDGSLEVLSLQNVSGLNKDDLLGKLAGVWSYNEGSGWTLKSKTFYSGGKNKDDKFHRSYRAKSWQIKPRQAVHESSSVTFPVFTVAEAPEVQNKVNGDFAVVAAPYLQKLANGGCELDYTLTFVGERFISMVFFGVIDEDGQELFAKIAFNMNAKTGKRLDIGEVLNLQDPDLLPVLRLLTKKDKVDFTKGVPVSWYYNGTNFVFCQRSESGEWLEATAAATDLKKFLLRPELF